MEALEAIRKINFDDAFPSSTKKKGKVTKIIKDAPQSDPENDNVVIRNEPIEAELSDENIQEVCNCSFNSQKARVADKSGKGFIQIITITQYINNPILQQEINSGKKKLVCDNGNILIKVEPEKIKSYFKHKTETIDNKMSDWHIEWQSRFENTEVPIGRRTADVVVNQTVLEFQHSPVKFENVKQRSHDYVMEGYTCHWIVDCNDNLDVIEGHDSYHITFRGDAWRYKSFMSQDHIYLNNDEMIYRIDPRNVKNNMIEVMDQKTEKEFIEAIEKNENIFVNNVKGNAIYLNQRGAGCGKTYESIQLMNDDPRFSHKDTFIYLTKMHSAKDVVFNEIKEQAERGALPNLSFDDTGGNDLGVTGTKQYYISYTNLKTEKQNTIIIGTIDSFVWAIGDKNASGKDYFKAILKSIKDGCVNVNKNGTIRYAQTTTKINKKCLIIIDEAQDLGPEYIEAFNEIVKVTSVDIYVIGDKLQSILGEHNIYTFLEKGTLSTPIIRSNGKNHVIRFHNDHFKDFVNSIIDFKKYDLPPVEKICDLPKCRYKHEANIPYTLFEIPEIMSNSTSPTINNKNINKLIEDLIKYMIIEIDKYNYLPKNFMFIIPFPGKSPLAPQLEARLQGFWIDKFNDASYQKKVLLKDDYWKNNINDKYYKYVYLHKSEEGQSINLKESENASRILSIHASKGNGCEVVFLLGISEYTCARFSHVKGNLQYDSLLHVAITRQKKSLYIGLEKNNDDIWNRFHRKYDIAEDESIEPHINITITNKYENVVDSIYENDDIFSLIDNDIIVPNKYENVILENNKSTDMEIKNIIDWGHHTIRAKVFYYNIMANIVENEQMDKGIEKWDQMRTVLHKISKLPVCKYAYDEYYKILKTRKNDNDRNIKNDNLETVMPVMMFKSIQENPKHYKYSLLITDIMEHIKQKITQALKIQKMPILCPLETTILLHMMDIFLDGIYGEISIIDIYSIMYCYDECSNSLDDNHTIENECLCRDIFFEGNGSNIKTTYTEIRKSIQNHYEKVEQTKELYKNYSKCISKISTKSDKFTYNVYHKAYFFERNANFAIIRQYPIIAYNDEYIVYIMIIPQLNKLNLKRTLLSVILSNFLLKNCDTCSENYTRYSEKKVAVCILTLDSMKPLFIDINLEKKDETIKTCIYKYLIAQYSSHHKALFDLYKYSKDNKPHEKDSLTFMCEKLAHKKYDRMPQYIKIYFADIKNEINEKKKAKDFKNLKDDILKKVNDRETFLTEIGSYLDKAAKEFLEIVDKDAVSDVDY